MKINWGCGPDVIDGWWNSDHEHYDGLDHLGRIQDGLPLDDEVAEIVVVNHALQMIPYPELSSVLAELARIVAPGGVLRILVPDLFSPHGALAAYQRADRSWFPVADDVEPTMGGKLAAYGLWYSTARSAFTAAWLSGLVFDAGLDPAVVAVGLTFADPESTALDKRPGETLVVEGVKR